MALVPATRTTTLLSGAAVRMAKVSGSPREIDVEGASYCSDQADALAGNASTAKPRQQARERRIPFSIGCASGGLEYRCGRAPRAPGLLAGGAWPVRVALARGRRGAGRRRPHRPG